MQPIQDILFEERAGAAATIGVMTLNRPAALNALNHSMILAMQKQLQLWAQHSAIKAVVIQAADGRAFCAGGDLRATYERHQMQDKTLAQFFYDEYQLNRFIFHYPKPYIALLDGITMGGGVGISIHGSHRVATDRLLFAMPETGIGFFTDVGGTYFLPRLSARWGYYLGLMGARLSADDCVQLGIAHHKIERESLTSLIPYLLEKKWGDDAYQHVTHVIEQFARPVMDRADSLLRHQQKIETCFSAQSVESILQRLQNSKDSFCEEVAGTLLKKSPTSLKVTLQALTIGTSLSFDACMQQEYRLASRFLEHHDFFEGIRAVIIDKDQTPHWQPSSLSQINSSDVDTYFAPLTKELSTETKG